MAIEFGNINKMTRDNFETAINYYEEKLTKMQSDESIDENTKKYFVDLYTARIKELKKLLRDLDNEIVVAKAGGYVNEKTATFESLGKAKSDSGTMDNISQNQEKYERAQFWRFVGAVLLPIVGTIPFIKKMIKAKKEFKAIENAKVQENIDLGKFVQDEKRPYEKNLGKKGNFSEAEKQILLSNQAEISRLEAALEDDTLNPAERKNLVAKLADLRKYAQENGYEIEDGVLADEAYETDKDKDERRIGELAGAVGEVSDEIENLVDAQEKVHRLEAQKKEAEKLLEKYPDNAELLNIIDNVDDKIESVINNTENFLAEKGQKHLDDIAAIELLSEDATMEQFNSWKNRCDAVLYNTSYYGVSIQKADEILEDIAPELRTYTQQVYDAYAAMPIDETKEKINRKTNVENLMQLVENDLKAFTEGDYSEDKDYTAEEVIQQREVLNRVKANLEKLKNEYGISETDAKYGTRYSDAKLNYNNLNAKVAEREEDTNAYLTSLEMCTNKLNDVETNFDTLKLNDIQTMLNDVDTKLTEIKDACDSGGKDGEWNVLNEKLNTLKNRYDKFKNDKKEFLGDEMETNIDLAYGGDLASVEEEKLKELRKKLIGYMPKLTDEEFVSASSSDMQNYIEELKNKVVLGKRRVENELEERGISLEDEETDEEVLEEDEEVEEVSEPVISEEEKEIEKERRRIRREFNRYKRSFESYGNTANAHMYKSQFETCKVWIGLLKDKVDATEVEIPESLKVSIGKLEEEIEIMLNNEMIKNAAVESEMT